MAFPLPPAPWNQALGLPMTHRFAVYFFAGGMIPNPLDIRFQEVSGMGATITTRPDLGSGNAISKKLTPTGIDYSDLVLNRGIVIGSPLSIQIQQVLNDFNFNRSDVMVTTFSEVGVPVSAWMFSEAFPVAWQIGSLNAQGENVLIETLKLTYSRMRLVKL